MPDISSISQFDHFIPVSTSRLIQRLASQLPADHCRVIDKLRKVIAYQYYQKLVELKRAYLPLNPDRELLIEQPDALPAAECIEQIRQVLVAANYSELDQQQIELALEKTSPYGLEIKIDFDAFDKISLFYRGKSSTTAWVRDWKTLYLKKKALHMIHYQRLFLLLSYRDQDRKPGLHLKLFKDILRPDLEMLFPESQVRIKTFDKLKIGITGGGGTAGGLFATIGKITTAVTPWTVVVAVGGFAMLIWRQVSKVFIQRTRYMATLAQNLYFHNLDNNAGAITYLVDLARQEEIKEAVLAYAMLAMQPAADQAELDDACEHWFVKNFERQIDFDVSDAVAKLKAFDLIFDDGGPLRCHAPDDNEFKLDQAWQSYL